MSLLGAAGISAGGGLLSGLFGGISQSRASKNYLKGVRETNEQNYKIWQEQQAHNIDMFNRENQANIDNWKMQFDATNAYNDPSAQVERLRNAGLNPSLALGGNASGMATSSSVGSAHAQPAQAPTMQAPQPVAPAGVAFAQNMLQGITQFANAWNMSQQTSSAEQKLPFELSALKDYASMQGMTKEFMKEFGKPMMQLDMAIKEGEVRRQTQSNFLNSMIQNDVIKTYQANRVLAECNAKNAQVLNNYFDESTQLDIAKKINEVALLASQKNWTDKQIDVAIAEIAFKFSQVALNNSIARLNNQEFQFNEDTRDLRIAGLKQDNLGKLYDNDQKRLNVRMLKSTFFDMLENARLNLMYNNLNLGNEIILQGTRRKRLTDPYIGNFFKYSLPAMKEFKESVPGVLNLFGF